MANFSDSASHGAPGRGCSTLPDALVGLTLPRCQPQTVFGGFAQQRCVGMNMVSRFRLGVADDLLVDGALCAAAGLVGSRRLDDCHLVGHEVGRELWRVRTRGRLLGGSELVATVRGMLSICPSSCVAGCAHQVLMEFVDAVLRLDASQYNHTALLNAACEFSDDEHAYACIHGLGHGFEAAAVARSLALESAFDRCERMSIMGQQGVDWCTGGVLMQLVTDRLERAVERPTAHDAPVLPALCADVPSAWSADCQSTVGEALMLLTCHDELLSTAMCGQLDGAAARFCVQGVEDEAEGSAADVAESAAILKDLQGGKEKASESAAIRSDSFDRPTDAKGPSAGRARRLSDSRRSASHLSRRRDRRRGDGAGVAAAEAAANAGHGGAGQSAGDGHTEVDGIAGGNAVADGETSPMTDALGAPGASGAVCQRAVAALVAPCEYSRPPVYDIPSSALNTWCSGAGRLAGWRGKLGPSPHAPPWIPLPPRRPPSPSSRAPHTPQSQPQPSLPSLLAPAHLVRPPQLPHAPPPIFDGPMPQAATAVAITVPMAVLLCVCLWTRWLRSSREARSRHSRAWAASDNRGIEGERFSGAPDSGRACLTKPRCVTVDKEGLLWEGAPPSDNVVDADL